MAFLIEADTLRPRKDAQAPSADRTPMWCRAAAPRASAASRGPTGRAWWRPPGAPWATLSVSAVRILFRPVGVAVAHGRSPVPPQRTGRCRDRRTPLPRNASADPSRSQRRCSRRCVPASGSGHARSTAMASRGCRHHPPCQHPHEPARRARHQNSGAEAADQRTVPVDQGRSVDGGERGRGERHAEHRAQLARFGSQARRERPAVPAQGEERPPNSQV